MTLYQRTYHWLRRHQLLRQNVQRILTRPAIQTNPLYHRIYHRRIQKIMSQGEPFPLRVQIEVTNRCNARCLMCPRDRLRRPLGVMPRSLSANIIDQCAAGGTHEVILSGYGEPLLDPHLEERITYAKEQGLPRVSTFTNGALLDEDRAHSLLSVPLDAITFSFDGATRQVYEHIRRGLSYNQVVENITRFRTLRDQRGQTLPIIYMNMVQQHDNMAETGAFMDRWQELADYVFVTALHNMGGVDKITALGPAVGSPRQYPCYHLWTGLTIYWDGTVGLCCVDFDGASIMGDLNKSSIREIWTESAFRAVRDWHQAGQYDRHPLCKDCTADHSWWHQV
ncbi:MAG: radical SAM protein [Chloroflexi bacterium]|nr:radical SAM protein [Chloroflexota bacterium]MBU1750602.1 radical SAM protein [Chloroflexota bacterium]MBU1877976.1 radical SAM protein [Chloroflexota bacterium]